MSNSSALLITSGTYIGDEMQSEFGRIPPAFLPVGSKYLIQHQLQNIGQRTRIYLSLPTDFILSVVEQQVLDKSAVCILRVDPEISLGFSVFQSILDIDTENTLEILHGDTLCKLTEVSNQNIVSIGHPSGNYKWGIVETSRGHVDRIYDGVDSDFLTESTTILSGYFCFSESKRLVRCLAQNNFSFTLAVNQYSQEMPVLVSRDLETLDLGHPKTFFASRKQLASARSFNFLSIGDHCVTKRGAPGQQDKLEAEANWFRNLPSELQPFSARLIEVNGDPQIGHYSTLYSNFPTLSDLYLARTSPLLWGKVLDSCQSFLNIASEHRHTNITSPIHWLVIDKLRERIGGYPEFLPNDETILTINNTKIGTLKEIVVKLENIVNSARPREANLMHGDFCFSNILYDTRSDRILLIDPRGIVNGKQTLFGDIRYDISKLGHSIVGRYDQIVGGQLIAKQPKFGSFVFSVPPNEQSDWLEVQFFKLCAGGVPFDDEVVSAATVSLFLSMIPLHSDSPVRQTTFFANALRLYQKFFGKV
jgi:hypothetical protein